MRGIAASFIMLCVSAASAWAQASADTVHIYFPLNRADLTTTARHTLDSLLYTDAINARKYLLVIGYTDYLGSSADNDVLSEKRARHTADYITGMGIDPTHIKATVGKGEILRTREQAGGYAQDRKVDIVIGTTNKIFTGTSPRPANNTPPPAEPATAPAPPRNNIATTIDNITPGQTFVLDNLYFHTGRHTLTDESLPELDKLLSVLQENPKLRIRIEGHVCCVPPGKDALDEDVQPVRDAAADPSPYYLRTLSLNRAKYIYYYLTGKGIASSRLSFEGFGHSRPLVAPERNMQDEEKNRRVEIRILEK